MFGREDPASSPFGYTQEQLGSLPRAAVALALGCANPVPQAGLRPGERVIDLGCGGGIDSLLADQETGEAGLVVGVDLLPPMLRRAKLYAELAHALSVCFVCADLEALPFPAAAFGVALSNNAFNLLEERLPALREAYRVLLPGGRLILADTVATGTARPAGLGSEPNPWAGLPTVEEYEQALPAAGFLPISFRQGPIMPRSGEALARPLLITASKPSNSLAGQR